YRNLTARLWRVGCGPAGRRSKPARHIPSQGALQVLNRRHVLMSAGALTLAACATAKPQAPPPPMPAPTPPAPPPAPPPPSASQQLSRLLDDIFQEELVEAPELASALGLD